MKKEERRKEAASFNWLILAHLKFLDILKKLVLLQFVSPKFLEMAVFFPGPLLALFLSRRRSREATEEMKIKVTPLS